MFLLVFYFAEYQYQTESNCDETFWRFFLDQKTPSGPKKSQEGGLWRAQPTRARQGAPGVPWWVVPSTGPLCTACDAYKFPNIRKTLGESMKHNSKRRKFQNREIQSKHHHGGVHLPHRCLFAFCYGEQSPTYQTLPFFEFLNSTTTHSCLWSNTTYLNTHNSSWPTIWIKPNLDKICEIQIGNYLTLFEILS